MDNTELLLDVKDEVSDIKKKLEELSNELSYVTIINGGNTEIQIKRKDFDQKNYNKPDEEKVKTIIKEKLDAYPTEKLTKWGDVTKNLMAILGFIGLIISIIKTSGL